LKAALVQDLDPLATGGGAQLTDRLIIREGFRRGHEIEIITPESLVPFSGYDMVLLSNVTRFNPRILNEIPRKIVFHHDYYFCRTRLYFPLLEKCKTCPYLPDWRRLFNGADLNVFMSPLHRDAILSVMPELSEASHHLCPCLIEPDKWPVLESPRKEKTVLGVNSLLPYKGRMNVLAYAKDHPDMSFTFTGAAEGEGEIPSNARWIGPSGDTQLRELYASNENFIHLPGTPQPAERTAVEARLSGCRLIVNAMVGITSFREWILPDREYRTWMTEQPERLWEAIESYA